jgi:hypothetical protein
LLLHPDFDIDQRDYWAKLRVRPEEFILTWSFADANRHDADRARALDAGEITAELAEFRLVFVELGRRRWGLNNGPGLGDGL